MTALPQSFIGKAMIAATLFAAGYYFPLFGPSAPTASTAAPAASASASAASAPATPR